MILQNIEKATYRKNLNKVLACSIVALLVIALGVSSLLIHFIGKEGESNFVLNLIGVCVSAGIVGAVLYRIRLSPFMAEVFYVWRLKQEINAIYRHSAKLKPALESNNRNALTIAYYNFKASIQLYELDDNDLTLSSIREDLLALETKIQDLDLVISTDDYHRGLLKQLT
tara:strand:+ start:623 stop:1132 length:510 start_codon:yes stop_codon:yes gene_type:complete